MPSPCVGCALRVQVLIQLGVRKRLLRLNTLQAMDDVMQSALQLFEVCGLWHVPRAVIDRWRRVSLGGGLPRAFPPRGSQPFTRPYPRHRPPQPAVLLLRSVRPSESSPRPSVACSPAPFPPPPRPPFKPPGPIPISSPQLVPAFRGGIRSDLGTLRPVDEAYANRTRNRPQQGAGSWCCLRHRLWTLCTVCRQCVQVRLPECSL